MLIKRLLSIALFATASVAYAQSSAPEQAARQPTPDEARQQNQQMAQAALQVAQLIDQKQEAQVWDGASPIAKQLVARDAFIKNIGTDRKTVGSLVTRSLAQVSYSQSDGSRLPPGVFANVSFSSRFANEKQPVRELISFHLDSDHVWRVAGYTLR